MKEFTEWFILYLQYIIGGFIVLAFGTYLSTLFN